MVLTRSVRGPATESYFDQQRYSFANLPGSERCPIAGAQHYRDTAKYDLSGEHQLHGRNHR